VFAERDTYVGLNDVQLRRALPAFVRSSWVAFLGGALIGVLGGLIGLGGAEFRLRLLIGLFGFVALEAIILNKAISLIVVASALVFRSKTVPVAVVSRARIDPSDVARREPSRSLVRGRPRDPD
jgi:hypothetical protein